MNKYLRALALLVACVGMSASASVDDLLHPYTVTDGRVLIAWYEACTLTGTDCTDVPVPRVVAQVFSYPTLRGLYAGGDTVFVSQSLWGYDLTDTMIHEMIHYIDTQVNGIPIPGPAELVCISEDRAWWFTGEYQKRTGRYDFTIDSQVNWWKWYPQCQ